METIEEIEEKIKQLSEKRNAMNEAGFNAALKVCSLMVGDTFAYRRNSYSCPNEKEYWDVFRKLIKIVKLKGCVWLIFQECGVDWKGAAGIRLENNVLSKVDHIKNPCGNGWKECSQSEFSRAFDDCMKQLNNPAKFAKWLSTV